MSLTTHLRRFAVRSGVVVGAVTALVVCGAGVASAHVTAHSPDQVVQGGDAEITFRVPNEEDSAGTVQLQVNFSTTSPIGDADVKPVPGWSAHVTTVKLANPVRMAKDTVTDAVRSITWTALPGTRINPGEFQEFSISVEGLPTNTDTMVMPAVQTYDNGDVVRWDQLPAPGQPEPEHPAPSIALTGAASASTPAASADSTARWLGGAGLALGALALGFGIGALLAARWRRGQEST